MGKRWKEYTELVGLAAVVASLVFVGMELRQAQTLAYAQMDAAAFANKIELRTNIIENADIWRRGNANEKLTPTEEVIYAQMALLENEETFFAILQLESLGIEEFSDIEVAELAGFFYENPRARQVWRAHEARLADFRGAVSPGDQTTSEWVQRVESAIAAIEQQH